MGAKISYGKAQIGVYRTYAAPLSGVERVAESGFEGRSNTLFAVEVDVEVFGDNFMPAYTEGDNSNVVATDTMKNFTLKQALLFEGSTPEQFLDFLGRRFLETYPQMHSLRLTGRELPFDPVQVPAESSGQFTSSGVLFSKSHNSYGLAVLEMEREGESGGPMVTGHRCGVVGLQLMKVTGSAFARFVRDEHTTLPERVDRPLYIYLDVYWRYSDTAQMLGADGQGYVPVEQVRDCVQTTFHRFVSMSIQHLLHEMGMHLLASFPQIAEVSFEAQNRLWDTAFESEENPKVKVYTDPRPPYGLIRLTLPRES
jgi:urate oxidase / 2-oxo-4-hydroxy-4-carboxy-5-ureidoimidazoline decarboxylase